MIIKLLEIDDTLTVKGSVEASRFMDVENDEFHITMPVEYELTVKKFDDLVTIQGPVHFEAIFTCGRCLEEFTQRIAVDMNIRLTSKAKLPQASELALKSEDMDVYFYDSDEIDLDPFIYEEALLDMPIRPICKEDCQGLCGVCGKNKNLETCDCHELPHTLFGEKLKPFLN
jgi:uncharacterized protein